MYKINVFLKSVILLFLYRIGFVFILNTEEEIDGNEDAGIALWRTFNYVAEESDNFQAINCIIHVSSFYKKSIFFFLNWLLVYIVRILLPCVFMVDLHLLHMKANY